MLNFKQNIDDVVARGTQLLGVVIRTTNESRNPMCIKAFYNSIVRSVLEYSCVVWCPTTASSIARSEAIQRKLTRYALSLLPNHDRNNHPRYAVRCCLLGLEPLSVRRRNAQCAFIAGMLNGSSLLLHRNDIYAPSRPLRSREILRVAQPRFITSRSMFSMPAIFNTVLDCFDFCFKSVLQRTSPASAVVTMNCDNNLYFVCFFLYCYSS